MRGLLRQLVPLFVLMCYGDTIYAEPQKQLPHILFVLVDDLGWGDVGFHRNTPTKEIQTPELDSLVQEGAELTRHYVHYACTPTRSSLQSGRLPVHVTIDLRNPNEPNAGIPENMTGIATKLKAAGYATHQVGKWDAGMATHRHTPQGRGYDSSLNYFTHKNNYWTQKDMQSNCLKYNYTDLWDTDKPAFGMNGSMYEEYMFHDRITTILKNHAASQPLFLFYAPHIVHCPLQVPEDQWMKFDFEEFDESDCHKQTQYIWPGSKVTHCRRTYHSMVNLLDGIIGNITRQYKAKGMWDNTLMILSADNGGPLTLPESGANNYPLRGGKYGPFEGGVRGTAFVSGGWLPQHMRGKTIDEIMHIADWYTTFATIAGVSPFDPIAHAAGLPPVDGFNMLPLITGSNTSSPRTEVPINKGGLIVGDYKVLVGKARTAGWTGPQYPNTTSPHGHTAAYDVNCGTKGCLYNVVEDPSEYNDLADKEPQKLQEMKDRLTEVVKGYYNNDDGYHNLDCPAHVRPEECCCWVAGNKWGGFLGPWEGVGPVPPNT